MKNKYRDLIEQTFDFPQQEFQLDNEHLRFHGIDLFSLVKKYGTPLKFSYLPEIAEKIDLCRDWFSKAFEENGYEGKYKLVGTEICNERGRHYTASSKCSLNHFVDVIFGPFSFARETSFEFTSMQKTRFFRAHQSNKS